jgi:hypothetical protein
VGELKNPGREWHLQGEAEQVRVYDFPLKGLGRATPYGVYGLAGNTDGSTWALTTILQRLP